MSSSGLTDTYNAAADLLGRNVAAHPGKVAYIDDRERVTFAELDDRVARVAGYLAHHLGLPMESRILICLPDSIDFVAACLGAIKAGLVPVMINPLLTSADFDYLLQDSRARVLITAAEIWPRFEPVVGGKPALAHVLISSASSPVEGTADLAAATQWEKPLLTAAPTRLHEPCLWQYSSGSTGRPKGTIHSHANLRHLSAGYPNEILGLTSNDVTFSAAKLFFGYGFGNGIVFPLTVGCTAVLMAERPTAAATWKRIVEHEVSVFFGVPTLYNLMMKDPAAPEPGALHLRLGTSAGEALPAEIGRRWRQRYGCDILDGIGSTEMLHIYLSNRIDDVTYGTTGRPVGGYELRLIGEDGREVAPGEAGELQIKGPTAALGYWCRREQTQRTFMGEWTRSGDTFRQDEQGRYVYAGRSDDMMKVGGIYVSPTEVEEALAAHPLVSEAAVIGCEDDAGLIKPRAFVVIQAADVEAAAIEAILKEHVKTMLAPYKYPRWIDVLDALPRTATGKVERYKLRARITSAP